MTVTRKQRAQDGTVGFAYGCCLVKKEVWHFWSPISYCHQCMAQLHAATLSGACSHRTCLTKGASLGRLSCETCFCTSAPTPLPSTEVTSSKPLGLGGVDLRALYVGGNYHFSSSGQTSWTNQKHVFKHEGSFHTCIYFSINSSRFPHGFLCYPEPEFQSCVIPLKKWSWYSGPPL